MWIWSLYPLQEQKESLSGFISHITQEQRFFWVHNAIKTWTLKNCREYKTCMTLPLSKLLLWFSALSFRVGVFFNAKTRVVLMIFFTIKNNNCKLKRWCVRSIKNKISRREALCVLKYLNLYWRNCSIIFC